MRRTKTSTVHLFMIRLTKIVHAPLTVFSKFTFLTNPQIRLLLCEIDQNVCRAKINLAKQIVHAPLTVFTSFAFLSKAQICLLLCFWGLFQIGGNKNNICTTRPLAAAQQMKVKTVFAIFSNIQDDKNKLHMHHS